MTAERRAPSGNGQRGDARRRAGAAAAASARTSSAACASSARTPSSTTSASAARGIARDDERRFALRVLDSVLGGTSSSRLFQEVRERRGLAYSVFSFSNLYAHTGEVGLYVGTRPENLAEALAVVAAELERCVARPGRARRSSTRSRRTSRAGWCSRMESTGGAHEPARQLGPAELPILSVDEVIARIEAVDDRGRARARRRAVRARALSVRRSARTRRRFRAALGAARRAAVGARDDPRGRRRRRRPHGPDGLRGGRAAPRTWSSCGAPTRCSARRSRSVLADAEVVVDFTRPDTALANALACVRRACTS